MDIEIFGVSAVLLIMALVNLAKSVGFNSKYGGILAVVLGILTSVGYSFFQDTLTFKAIITGLALGLSAAGLYSTQKNIRE